MLQTAPYNTNKSAPEFQHGHQLCPVAGEIFPSAGQNPFFELQQVDCKCYLLILEIVCENFVTMLGG